MSEVKRELWVNHYREAKTLKRRCATCANGETELPWEDWRGERQATVSYCGCTYSKNTFHGARVAAGNVCDRWKERKEEQ